LLELVGLAPAHLFLDRFPHQLSVGQRQRACIARAVASRPSLLVADEAVSALDISIRAQVLKLMKELQAALVCPTCSLLTTSRLIRSLADRAIVMYLGQVVEEGTVDEILFFPEAPLYPSAT
jgi:ABC-type oligopeptide transport system ATPase subunit